MERNISGKKIMKRIYEDGTNTGIQYFVGTEVEHTPAFGKKTLFVVGITDPVDIVALANENAAEHIYLGANQSFSITGEHGTDEEIKGWEGMTYALLKAGFWVTLDFDIRYTEWIVEAGFTSYNKFIPMISAKLPYIEQLGYNACLKLDDRDFDASNPGVWVHSVHSLQDRTVFTDWSKYTTDKIIS